jgi:hypothetical protein
MIRGTRIRYNGLRFGLVKDVIAITASTPATIIPIIVNHPAVLKPVSGANCGDSTVLEIIIYTPLLE